MPKESFVQDWCVPMLVISGSYILAFFATFTFVMPIQNSLFPAFGNYASLLFLPHGVRVVSAWLYGWRSIALLAPGAVFTHSYLYGSDGFSIDYMMAVFFGVFCAALSFWFFARMGMEFRIHKSARRNWRDVMLVGGAASVLNAGGTAVFFGNDLATMSARFLGDLTGMIVSTYILMLIFRFARRRES